MLGLVIRELEGTQDIQESTLVIKNYILENFNLNVKYFQYYYEDAMYLGKSKYNYVHMPFTVKIENSHKYLHTLNTYLKNMSSKVTNIIIHLKNESPNDIVEFLDAYQAKFNNQLDKYNIYWEHSVNRKNKYFEFKEIQNLMLTFNKHSNISNNLCLDTCHIHNMGYDISSPDAVKAYFKPIFKLARILKFKLLVHLNDSEDKIGSYKDRHASIGKTIWKNSDGYVTLIEMCNINKIPYILEIPSKNYVKSINKNISKILI